MTPWLLELGAAHWLHLYWVANSGFEPYMPHKTENTLALYGKNLPILEPLNYLFDRKITFFL